MNADSPQMKDTKDEARQLKSLDQLQEWSKWMVGVEALTLGFASTSEVINQHSVYSLIVIFATLTVAMAAWVLSGIPSVTRRVRDGVCLTTYSLYDIEFFNKWKITLNKIATAQHVLFFLALICVAYAFCVVIPSSTAAAVECQRFKLTVHIGDESRQIGKALMMRVCGGAENTK